MKILKPRGMNLQKYKLPSSAPASSSFNFNLRAELELISNYPHHPPNHPRKSSENNSASTQEAEILHGNFIQPN